MSLATFTSYAVLNAIGLKVDRCAEAIKYREKELSKRRAHTAARASESLAGTACSVARVWLSRPHALLLVTTPAHNGIRAEPTRQVIYDSRRVSFGHFA